MISLPVSMRSLSKTRSGLPVPYVAMWEGEEMHHIANDPLIGNVPALFSSPRREGGEAVLGKMEVSRQREVVARGRCQVCRCALSARDRFVVSLWEQHHDGTRSIREPWACTSCLAFALRVCPGLIGARKHDGLHVIRMSKWMTILAHTSIAGLVRDGLMTHDPNAPETAYGYAKIVPYKTSIVLSVEAFLKSFG